MYIKKRSAGKFQVLVQVNKTRHYATFSTRRECELWGKRTEKQLKAFSSNKSLNIKLKDLMLMYKKDYVSKMKTKYEQSNKIDHLIREYKWLVNLTLLEALEVKHWLKFRNERLEDGPDALNQSLTIFNVLFNKIKTVYEYPIDKNPIVFIDRAKTNTYGRLRVITYKEYKSILKNVHYVEDKEKLMYQVFYLLNRHCGFRPFCETRLIKWSQVDDINNQIFIGKSKTNSGIRSMPIPKWLMKKIIKLKPYSTSEYIFNRSKSGLEKNFQSICKVYNIEDLQVYDLRRNYCRRLVLKGYGIKDVAKAMGHSFVTANKMVELYSGFTWERNRHKIVN